MINNNEGKYGKYIIQTLQESVPMDPEFKKIYDQFAKRILMMDSSIVPGSLPFVSTWYKHPQPIDPVLPAHVHENFDELLGFYGSNADDPNNLNGVIEYGIDGEMYRLDKSSLIFMPKGLSHGPLRILEVNEPIFHFSMILSADVEKFSM